MVDAGGETLAGQNLSIGVYAFLGIPFAAAPTGDLRWEAAVPHIPRSGQQDASHYGPACPQSQGNPEWYRMVAEGFGSDPSVIPDLDHMDEDCLYLNVWSPTLTPKANLPVMIWIHGGSNVNGWAYETNYVGNKLAEKGVVVISVNYRMGALGFLPLPFMEERSGNYGLSDLIAAIKWTNENAAEFGGDPANITLIGESAGAGNIYALMKSPKTKGIFKRAIIESGALGPADSLPYETVMARSEKMFEAIGISTLKQARDLPWQALIDLHDKTVVAHYHGPVVDDVYVRAGGKFNAGIDVLAGSNLNEMLMYLDDTDPNLLAENLATYPLNRHNEIKAFLNSGNLSLLEQADVLSTASEFHCPAVFIADAAAQDGNAAYVYRFTRKRDRAGKYGAYHGAEIPYVFGTHDNWLPTDETDLALTEVMMAYWTNFARTGNPNGDELPNWPIHKRGTDQLQILGDKVKTVPDFAYTLCNFLKDRRTP